MCTSPLVRYRYKYFPKKLIIPEGGSKYTIYSQKKLESLFESYSQYLMYINTYLDYQIIPCNKCNECKSRYAEEWAIRCYHELQYSDCASFITLTFEPGANIKYLKRIEKSFNGKTNCHCKQCIKGNKYYRYPLDYSLNKAMIQDWLQLFRKRLQKKGINIRYFGCGEYGETEERPHYHFIIYNYDFPDKQFWKKSKTGFNIYRSEELEKIWEYGFTTVQNVEYGCLKYVAKYVTKKLKSMTENEIYEKYYGREIETLFMSKGNCQANRCPHIDELIKKGTNSLRNLTNETCKKCKYSRGGLGYKWLENNWRELYTLKHVQVEGFKKPIPRYYKKILELTNKNEYDNLKTEINKKVDESREKKINDLSTERLNVRKQARMGKEKFVTRNL